MTSTLPSSDDGFRVIIAGAGLAGLTLANALERAGIDYVLLEARDVIAPAVGASMGMFPNGMRILDQLGCVDDISELTYGIKSAADHDHHGNLIHERSDGPLLAEKRTGYKVVFLNRQLVLEVLHKHIQDKGKILTSKRISRVEQSAHGVTVYCDDGTTFDGDLIAGADGVYSTVRQEMWRAADREEPGLIPEKEKKHMKAEYQVLYGISTATKGLPKGNYDVTYMKDQSSMFIVDKDDIVYWFIFKRMNKVHYFGDIPRYTKKEAEEFAADHANLNLETNGSVKFGDVWKNRTHYTLVATEEADFEHWTWGRFACLGDSVHKVTPNAGVGGNAAYESAASLANSIKDMLDSSSSRPSTETVKTYLKQFEKERRGRTSMILKPANDLTRVHALKGFKEWFTVFQILPRAGDMMLDIHADWFIGAVKLNFLPVPERSLAASQPFNPQQGIDKKESILYRLALASPFLLLSAICLNRMDNTPAFSELFEILQNKTITWENGSMPLPDSFYHIDWLDNLWRGVTVFFASWNLGIDQVAWWQMLSFIADFGVLYSIMLVESVRRANTLTFAQLPSVFGLIAQFKGIGVVGPVYFYLHYISSQIANFRATDHRLTNLTYTRTILPVMAVSFYLPHFVSHLHPDLKIRHSADWIWQMFPVWVSLLQRLLAYTVMPDTIQHDRIHNPKRDVDTVRFTIGTTVAIAACVWWYTLATSPFSPITIFIPHLSSPTTGWTDTARNVLQYDHISCWGSALLWMGYLFADLKDAGMVTQSWARIIFAGIATTLVMGPGSAVGLGWLWREDTLINKRHKGAVTRESIARDGGVKLNGYAEKA